MLIVLLMSTLGFFVQAQKPSPDTIQTSAGVLTIQPVQHASLILTINGTTIYADPSGIENFKGYSGPDIILISDIHGDHFDVKTIDAIKKKERS